MNEHQEGGVGVGGGGDFLSFLSSFFFFLILHCSLRKCPVTLPGSLGTAAATGVAPPIPASVGSTFVPLNDGMAASDWDF